MKKKLTLALLCFVLFVSAGILSGCKNNNEPKDNVSKIEASALNSKYVKWNGRTHYDESEELQYFFYAASGFTVKFYGTKLDATFYATQVDSNSKRPVFAVAIDNELIPNNVITVSEENKSVVQNEKVVKLTANNLSSTSTINGKEYNFYTVNLVNNLKMGYHTVTLYKQGEATDNTTAVKSLATDKTFVSVPDSNKLKVQILGSSGITGFGSLHFSTNQYDGRTTSNSSGMYSMGGLAALMYNAEVEFVSVSGWTLVDDGRGIDLPHIYNHAGRTETGAYKINNQTVQHNHQKWQPDVIILNIGGNDESVTPQQTSRTAKSFTNTLHLSHPNANIVWTGRAAYGSTISGMVTDLNVDYVKYAGPIEGNGGDNMWGAGNHASVKTQLNNANIIVNVLKTMLNVEPTRTFSVNVV